MDILQVYFTGTDKRMINRHQNIHKDISTYILWIWYEDVISPN